MSFAVEGGGRLHAGIVARASAKRGSRRRMDVVLKGAERFTRGAYHRKPRSCGVIPAAPPEQRCSYQKGTPEACGGRRATCNVAAAPAWSPLDLAEIRGDLAIECRGIS